MITHERPNPLTVLDAVIADMRASGDTGHVENLLQARADFVELANAAQGASGWVDQVSLAGCAALNRLDKALAAFGRTP